MNYKGLHSYYIVKNQKLFINKKTIFIVFPDTNINIANELYNANILLSNCSGVICPNKIMTIGRRKFNGKLHYLDIKKQLMTLADQKNCMNKKLKVISNFITSNKSGEDKASKFYFYDASIWSHALDFLLNNIAERSAYKLILDELTVIYKKIKEIDPTYDVDLLFLIKNQNGKLYNFFKNIKILVKMNDFENLKLFDNFTLVSDCENVIIPIIDFAENKTHLIINNLNKLDEFIEASSIAKEINNTSVVDDKKTEGSDSEEQIESPGILEKVVTALQTSKLSAKPLINKNDDIEIKMDINYDDLRKALKHYKITDPDIIANVKTSLDNYINTEKIKPDREKAESLVLKSINYTLSGNDEVPDEYLNKPSILFNKLKQIDTYKVPLNIPNNPNNLLSPNKLIDLKFTTGQHRQKFEFEEAIHDNIKKLFSSLETVGSEFPIKVKNIEWTVEDNNADRYIDYKVTLQNVNGGKKEPYVVQLKVPAPVNDKYFKLHGNSYIMSTQQFLRPITKTDKHEVRLISNYGIVRIGLSNIKFNPSDIDEIVKFINIKYPTLIKKLTDEYVQFSDDSFIYFIGNTIYKSTNQEIIIDPETNKLKDIKNNIDILQAKCEFLYDTILDKIHSINPEENLTKTKKVSPFIWIYLGKIKMPLILYLWSQKGLLSSLNDYGINYKIVNKEEMNYSKQTIYIPTKDDQYLEISPKNIKETVIVSALGNIKFKYPINNFEDPQEIYPLISELYGSRAINLITLLTQNFVDPITKELLEFENHPTNLISLSSTTAVNQLLNKKLDSLSDLKIYRSRLSEVILHIVYKQIKMSQNNYKQKCDLGDDSAQVYLVPDYVINNLLTEAGVLQQIEPISPVAEIMMSSRVTKGGKGGVPSKRSFKKEHRNIHPSQYGNIGAVSTPEYADVGLTTHHTLSPIIVNKYGSYGIKDITNASGWNVLALDEALTPFQNQVDSDRLTLARTHATQITPVSNAQAPLVCSGAEFITGQIASQRFIQKSKKDGQIIEVDPNKTITVKYKDGSIEVFDIIPRMSRTKRGSYISLEMDTLPIGTKVVANQPIAFTKNFDKNGTYCAGKNVTVAIFNYLGLNHEDSYVVSQSLADNTKTDTVEEVHIIIPPDTKVIQFVKDKKTVENGDVLVEFSYNDNLDDYLNSTNLIDEEESENTLDMYSSGLNSVKLLAPDGDIIDIKIFINNRNSTDKTLLNYHAKMVNDQKKIIGKLATNIKDKDKIINVTDNMDLSFTNIGNHKYKGAVFVGARIVYYIKRPKDLKVGDKMSNRYGAKGVISKILVDPPRSDFSGEINTIISPISILGRKNVSMIKELYLGKIFKYVNTKIIEMANDPKITNDNIIKFISDLYTIIGPKKVADQVLSSLTSQSAIHLRKAIKEEEVKLYCLVEPFEDIPFINIKNAAKFLGIPLEERVYIPELKQWTKTPIPVGVSYYQFLEHFSDVYANIRGTGKFVGLTRQPTKRKSQEGGQSIARLDIYSLLSFGANNILTEMLGARSDEHRAKRVLYNKILETGESPSISEVTTESSGGTKNIFNLYMIALGLKITSSI